MSQMIAQAFASGIITSLLEKTPNCRLRLCSAWITEPERPWKIECSGKWKKCDVVEGKKKFRRGSFGVAQSPKQSSGGTMFMIIARLRIAREDLQKRGKNSPSAFRRDLAESFYAHGACPDAFELWITHLL